MTPRIMDAKAYCIWAHGDQKRKYTEDPYWTHPERVAKYLEENGYSEDVQIAAWHHDVIEDTQVTYADYLKRWGYKIGSMVQMLTTEKRTGENRADRKYRELARLAGSTHEEATIKLADLIDNTNDIVNFDASFAKVYLKEKAGLLGVLQHGHAGLLMMATNQVRRGLAKLDEDKRKQDEVRYNDWQDSRRGRA